MSNPRLCASSTGFRGAQDILDFFPGEAGERVEGQKQTRSGVDFGRGATKQRVCDPAEYRTLIAALKDLMGRIQRAGKSPSDYSLLVHTDSQLIVGQLTQGWRVKAANLRPLVDEATSLIQAFGRCDLVKVPRDEIVRVLGH
jgi:ribonuclease HI